MNDPTVQDPQKQLEQRRGMFTLRLETLLPLKFTPIAAALAQELIEDADAYLKEAHKHFDPPVVAAYNAHKEATALRKKFLDAAEAVLDAKKFNSARSWLKRYELDRREKVERERRAAEELQRKQDEERRAAVVKQLEEAGQPELAAEQAKAPLPTTTVTIDESKGKVEGQSFTETWRGEVEDMTVFLKHVADNQSLWGLVEVKQGALDRFVNGTKGLEFPGVKVSKDLTMRRT